MSEQLDVSSKMTTEADLPPEIAVPDGLLKRLYELHPLALQMLIARTLLRSFPALAKDGSFNYWLYSDSQLAFKMADSLKQSAESASVGEVDFEQDPQSHDARVTNLFVLLVPVLSYLQSLDPRKNALITLDEVPSWFSRKLQSVAQELTLGSETSNPDLSREMSVVLHCFQLFFTFWVDIVGASFQNSDMVINTSRRILENIQQLHHASLLMPLFNSEAEELTKNANGRAIADNDDPFDRNPLQQLAVAPLWHLLPAESSDYVGTFQSLLTRAFDTITTDLSEQGESRAFERSVFDHLRQDYETFSAFKPSEPIKEQQVKGKLSAEIAHGEDRLNRTAMAAQLATWLSHKDNFVHQTIGILGHWGIGKSYFIDLVEQALISVDPATTDKKGEEFLFGEFNAWSYEHTENIQAGLAHEVLQALTSKPDHYRGWRNFTWFFYRLYLIWTFSVATQGKRMAFLLLGLLVVAFTVTNTTMEDWFGWLGLNNTAFADNGLAKFLLSATVSGGLLVTLWSQLRQLSVHALAKELKTYIKLPNYAKKLGEIPVMKQQINTLCNIRLSNKRRLLFVIDDLDRCGPEGIVKTLEAIRLVLEIQRVIVIIAVDERIALAALALHYQKLAEHHHHGNARAIARDYLAKIIHLPITLNEPDNDSVSGYLSHLWEDKTDDEKNWRSIVSVVAEEKAVPQGEPEPKLELGPEESLEDRELKQRLYESYVSAPTLKSLQPQPTEVVVGLLPDQKAAFYQWSTYFNLANPRQLKRLYNSYNLLRLCFGEDSKVTVDGAEQTDSQPLYYKKLITLCALEYINNNTNPVWRATAKAQLRANVEQPLEKFDKFKPPIFAVIRGLTDGEFLQVDSFVLPAAELLTFDNKSFSNAETKKEAAKME